MFHRTCITALILFLLFPSVGWATFVASPMELHMTVDAGAFGSAGVALTNTGDRPLTLRLYLADSRFLPDGTEENLPPGTVLRSCAPWVALGEQVVELAPGEARHLTFNLSVPDGYPQGDVSFSVSASDSLGTQVRAAPETFAVGGVSTLFTVVFGLFVLLAIAAIVVGFVLYSRQRLG